MKLVTAIGGSGMLLGGLYAGGALTTGEVYELPLAQTRAELIAMPLSVDARIAVGGSDGAAVTVHTSPNSISWSFADGSRIIAHLRAETAGSTRIILEHETGTSGSDPLDRLTSTAFMRSFAETTFHEQVDAHLERRAFDSSRALQAFARTMAEDPRQVEELGLAIEGTMIEMSEQVAATADGGFVPDQVDAHSAMKAATRPSLTLPKQD